MDFKDMLNKGKKEKKPEPLPAVSDLDLDPVKEVVAEYEVKLKQLEAQAKKYQVTDNVTSEHIVELGARSAKLVKALTADRKERIEKEDKFVRAVNKLYKPLTDAGARIKRICGDKFGQYQAKVKLAEQKREKAAQEAQAKLQKQLDDQAKEAGVEGVEAAPITIPKAPGITRTETGSASVRKVWTWEVDHADDVPKEYWVLNDAMIEKQVKAGVRNIPGIKIFQKESTTFRT
jgi:hypothetical protein